MDRLNRHLCHDCCCSRRSTDSVGDKRWLSEAFVELARLCRYSKFGSIREVNKTRLLLHATLSTCHLQIFHCPCAYTILRSWQLHKKRSRYTLYLVSLIPSLFITQSNNLLSCIPDLKNTSDDAIPTYLNSLQFKQSHTLSDIRLALGYTAFAICAATFYWDYKFGFESTKLYTAIAVALYTVLNSFLTFWVWGVEKGSIYIGTAPSGEKIEISSSVKKHMPRYNLVVKTTAKDGQAREQRIERPFMEWFDGAGHFVARPFQQMFASNVEVIGMVDTKNVVRKEKKVKAPVDDGKTMDEKWASLLAESSGAIPAVVVESTATPAKGTKRRGKKA